MVNLLESMGTDVIVLGIPFSDPLADDSVFPKRCVDQSPPTCTPFECLPEPASVLLTFGDSLTACIACR